MIVTRIIGPVSCSLWGKRRKQGHDTNRTPGRLSYRSRGWIKEASDLVLESGNAV
jgi:hypothetical protein